MTEPLSTQERFKRGAADAGRYWQFMAEFIGFTPEDAATIRETRFIVEKYIPAIVSDFYIQLLRYPATRRHFLRQDGSVDEDYLRLRMHHQAGFWRRTASGDYDEDYARFVDYVGRAHTSSGADPRIYIAQRYVMGMVGFVQDRLGRALATELHEIDPELELRGNQAWNRLLMVLLEVLSRPYGSKEAESFEPQEPINDRAVHDLAVDTYERGIGVARKVLCKEVHVGSVGEIPDGTRRIIQVDDLSVGVFHHQGAWVALQNSCLHRGGPVCTGKLEGNVLTCPWHGYEYDVTTGQLLLDKLATLPRYEVEVRDEQVYVYIPQYIRDTPGTAFEPLVEAAIKTVPAGENELYTADLPPGKARRVTVAGEPVAVYNVGGAFYATHDECTHAGGPLSEGELRGDEIICPWHASCFKVTTGEVTCRPAKKPVRTYRVVVNGDILRVEA